MHQYDLVNLVTNRGLFSTPGAVAASLNLEAFFVRLLVVVVACGVDVLVMGVGAGQSVGVGFVRSTSRSGRETKARRGGVALSFCDDYYNDSLGVV